MIAFYSINFNKNIMTAYKLKKGYTDDINRIQDIIFKCFGVNTTIVNNKIIFNY